MAKLLVERRTDAFASRYPRTESERRVRAAIEGFAPKAMVYDTAWRDEGGAAFLDVTFTPSPSTQFFLYGSRRDAEEATLRRRIRRAIVEEEPEES